MSRWRARLRGLAGVEALGGEEFFEPRIDPVGDFRQEIGAFGDSHSAPRTRKRRLRGAHRRVDLRPPPLGDAADHAVVERCAVLPELAGRAVGEGAVDEVGGVAPRAVEALRRLLQSLNRHRHSPSVASARVSRRFRRACGRTLRADAKGSGLSFLDRLTRRPTGTPRSSAARSRKYPCRPGSRPRCGSGGPDNRCSRRRTLRSGCPTDRRNRSSGRG